MRSNTATSICKVCLKEIENDGVTSLLLGKMPICLKCYNRLHPKPETWKVDNVSCHSIYRYDEGFRSLLYQYKGCRDIELSSVFLARIKFLLKAKYAGFAMIPAPSSKKNDAKRGFNQVIESFSTLGLPILRAIEKLGDSKQSDLSKGERSKVGKYLNWVGPDSLEGQSILLVDDVYTTGSTIKACLSLIKARKPKKVEVLVLAKTPIKEG